MRFRSGDVDGRLARRLQETNLAVENAEGTGPAAGRSMPPTVQVRLRMSEQRRADTAPELAIRKLVHAVGLRYRVDAPLPGMPRRRADMLFRRARMAVFVDGCFWHRCPVHFIPPKSNSVWWAAKLAANVERDRDTDRHLEELGWRSLRIWEHEDPLVGAQAVVDGVRRPLA